MDAPGDAPRPGAARKITDEQVEVAGHADADRERAAGRTVTGRPGRWPPRPGCRSRRSRGSGGPSASSRTLVETWKLSTDPEFIGKVRDVVGLYMTPPENALVLAVDEKSQIQALDRTAPCLPMLPTTPDAG